MGIVVDIGFAGKWYCMANDASQEKEELLHSEILKFSNSIKEIEKNR